MTAILWTALNNALLSALNLALTAVLPLIVLVYGSIVAYSLYKKLLLISVQNEYLHVGDYAGDAVDENGDDLEAFRDDYTSDSIFSSAEKFEEGRPDPDGLDIDYNSFEDDPNRELIASVGENDDPDEDDDPDE